jgi:hypothetical protein
MNNDKELKAIDPDTIKQAAEQTSDSAAIFEKAMLNLPNDAGALYESDVIAALKTLRQKDELAYTRLCAKAKGHTTRLNKLTAPEREGREDNQISSLIQDIRNDNTIGHDANGRGIAVIDQEGVRRVFYINATGFAEWFRSKYYEASGSGLSDQLLAIAVNTLSAIGMHEGNLLEVHMRCAKHNGDYYIDLCNNDWSAICVNAQGWSVVKRPPILFIRTRNMRALPMPQTPGNLSKLWPYINIPHILRVLLMPWMIDCYRSDTPFPILELCGEQGSAKSTTQRRLRELIDPNQVALRGRPKTVEDIYVSAANNWIVSLENLSHLTPEQQDAFCTLATGGGHAARELYTNGDEFVLETKRPVMMNGINQVATQPDLIERAISIEAPTIPTGDRLDEQTITANWALDYATVFAGVLDLFTKSLAILPTVVLDKKYRMADFQLLGEAVAQAMGHDAGHFTEVYGASVSDGIGRSMDTYGLANAMQLFMAERSYKQWEGTFLALKAELESLHGIDKSNWPKSPRGLAGQLKRLAQGLRQAGIVIESLGRSTHGSSIRITFSKSE